MNFRNISLTYLLTVVLAHGDGAGTIIFQDNFDVDEDTALTADIFNPESRGGVVDRTKFTTGIRYEINGAETIDDGGTFEHLKIVNELTEGSSDEIVVGDALKFNNPTNDIHFRFYDSSGTNEIDFAPHLGSHYKISFKMKAAFGRNFGFSMSDNIQAGRYNAFDKTEYDLAVSSYQYDMRVGASGLIYDSQYHGGITDYFKDNDYSSTDYLYPGPTLVEIEVKESDSVPNAATVSVSYDGVFAVEDYAIDFDSDGRYMQFTARNGYTGMFDDLTITTYAVPELKSTVLIIPIFAVSICLTRRSRYSL